MNLRKKKFRTILALLTLLAVTTGSAQSLKIYLNDDSTRELTIANSIPSKPPVGGREFASKLISIPLSQSEQNGFVILIDKKKGWVAVKKISEIKAGEWKVADKEWSMKSVNVEVNQGGKPLRSGKAILEVSGNRVEALIADGKSEFFNVPFGASTVTVEYEDSGKSNRTTPQKFLFEKEHANPVVAITVPGSAPISASQVKPTPSKRFSFANIFIWLLALVAGAAVLLLVLKLLKNNEEVVADRLRKMGVSVPEPISDNQQDTVASMPIATPLAAPPLVPEGHCEFCGQLVPAGGVCSCAMTSQKSVPVLTKTLTGNGVTFQLAEGTHILGREAEWMIPDPTVSRKHAQIDVVGSSITLKDLGSSNGTFLNGKQINSEEALAFGDTIQLGNFVLKVDA